MWLAHKDAPAGQGEDAQRWCNLAKSKIVPGTKSVEPLSALADARLKAVRDYTGAAGLTLDEDTYKALRRRGLSRRDVDRAVDALVAAGEAIVETTETSRVRVRLVKSAPVQEGA